MALKNLQLQEMSTDIKRGQLRLLILDLPDSPPLSGPTFFLSGTERASSSVVTMVSVSFSERLGDDSGGVGVASSSETGRGLMEAPLLLGTSDSSVFVVTTVSLEKLSALRLGSALLCSIRQSAGAFELDSAMISQTSEN